MEYCHHRKKNDNIKFSGKCLRLEKKHHRVRQHSPRKESIICTHLLVDIDWLVNDNHMAIHRPRGVK